MPGSAKDVCTYSVQQDAAPGCALAREQVRKLQGQDDSLLQRLFRALEAAHIAPPHVGLFLDNGAWMITPVS
jgi:hypothetical protein